MGIKSILKQAGGKAADAVAKLSVLSPEQLAEMQARREAYLSEIPSVDNAEAEAITNRMLAAASIEIYNEYLSHIQDIYAPLKKDAEYSSIFNPAYNIRYINITKWVTDKKENGLEKLVNVYDVLSDEECNIALVFHRKWDKTKVYLAVTNTKNAKDNVDVENYRKRLIEAIRGNFPGAEWAAENGKGVFPCMAEQRPYSVASASNIPGEKSEKFISQTIEKLLDGIIPDDPGKEYILVLLATPIQDVEDRKLHLADLYSGLAPYAGWQTQFTYSELDSTNSNATFGVNAGVSAGVQAGLNSSVANTNGITNSTGKTETDSTGTTNTESSGNSSSESTNNSVTNASGVSSTTGTGTSSSTSTTHSTSTSETESTATGVFGSASGQIKPFGVGIGVTGGASHSHSASTGSSVSEALSSSAAVSSTQSATQSASQAVANSIGKAITSSTGKAVAKSVGKAVANTLSKAVSRSVTSSLGSYGGVNLGSNFGANFARSSNVSATVGKNEGITQTFTNYTIKHTLEILEAQMKRLEQSTALGMWDFAAYVISEDQNVANNVAHSYLALTQGEQSYMTHTAVNLWRGRLSRKLCKPPFRCRIGASQWRFTIWEERIARRRKKPGERKSGSCCSWQTSAA